MKRKRDTLTEAVKAMEITNQVISFDFSIS